MRPQENYQAELREIANRLRDPVRLRIALCGLALVVAYFGVYGPLSSRIEAATRKRQAAERRMTTAQDVEFLRAQAAMIESRVGPSSDANESVHYVLDGIRALPVQLVRLDSDAAVSVGPYEAVVLRVELEGRVQHLDAFLEWLETNERLFRVDSFKLRSSRGKMGEPTMQLVFLALKVRS